jgi:hypothetical protein
VTQLILSLTIVGMVITITWVIVDAFLIPGWVRRQNNLLAHQLGAWVETNLPLPQQSRLQNTFSSDGLDATRTLLRKNRFPSFLKML